jgi:hypothetical protein
MSKTQRTLHYTELDAESSSAENLRSNLEADDSTDRYPKLYNARRPRFKGVHRASDFVHCTEWISVRAAAGQCPRQPG